MLQPNQRVSSQLIVILPVFKSIKEQAHYQTNFRRNETPDSETVSNSRLGGLQTSAHEEL